MALKNLMARLQSRATDTPDTPEKIMGYERKAPIHAGCTSDTSDTPRFIETPVIVQIVQLNEAVNDPAQAVGLVTNLPVTTLVTSEPPEPPTDPNAWRELAAAYHAHHFKCSTCIAAGRGVVYGLRCGTGMALWINYQNT